MVPSTTIPARFAPGSLSHKANRKSGPRSCWCTYSRESTRGLLYGDSDPSTRGAGVGGGRTGSLGYCLSALHPKTQSGVCEGSQRGGGELVGGGGRPTCRMEFTSIYWFPFIVFALKKIHVVLVFLSYTPALLEVFEHIFTSPD